MSDDNRFLGEESDSFDYPGEERYSQGEKIKPQPTFSRRHVWQLLIGALIILILVVASFAAGLLSRQEQVIVITKVLPIAPTQPQIEPTQISTPAPPTSVKLLLSAPGSDSTGKSVITLPSGTPVRLTVVPDHSLLPFQPYSIGIYATDPFGFSELQSCTYPNTATCSYIVAYSSSENTDYTKGQHTFRAFLGDSGGTILTNSNSITILWS